MLLFLFFVDIKIVLLILFRSYSYFSCSEDEFVLGDREIYTENSLNESVRSLFL